VSPRLPDVPHRAARGSLRIGLAAAQRRLGLPDNIML
jgi:hypothetical protein